MRALTVALLQMAGCGMDMEANLRKGDRFCHQAAELGADVALFPEMWSIAYTPCPPHPEGRAAWAATAVGVDDEFVRHFRRLAVELEMAIALTYLERWEPAPRNSVTVIDRHGAPALTYAKVHTCAFDWEASCTPGDEFHVCELDTALGPVRVGAMICFDREFPESARVLMLEGAELILTPNSCTLEANRIGQFRARAFENMVALAMTNYASPQNNGHSVAFDAAAFEPDETSRDTLLVEAGEEEGVHLAHFDLAELRGYRNREVWGGAYRRPQAYRPLVT